MAITGPVQQVTGTTGASPVISYSITIAAPTAGHSLIACISTSTSQHPVSSISGGGVTWRSAVAQTIGTGTPQSQIWFGHNSSGAGTTVTITYATAAKGSCSITEWSGLTNGVANSTCVNSANADSTPTAGSVVTNSNNSLIVSNSSWAANGYSSGPNNSFTRGTAFNDGVHFGEMAFRIITVNGAYTVTWQLTTPRPTNSAIVIFGGASIGPLVSQSTTGFFV